MKLLKRTAQRYLSRTANEFREDSRLSITFAVNKRFEVQIVYEVMFRAQNVEPYNDLS